MHIFFHLLVCTVYWPLCVFDYYFVQIIDGEWSLDDAHLVSATFQSTSSLECQLPVDDSQSSTTSHPSVSRWQIKVNVTVVRSCVPNQ